MGKGLGFVRVPQIIKELFDTMAKKPAKKTATKGKTTAKKAAAKAAAAPTKAAAKKSAPKKAAPKKTAPKKAAPVKAGRAAKPSAKTNANTDTLGITDGGMKDAFRNAFMNRPL